MVRACAVDRRLDQRGAGWNDGTEIADMRRDRRVAVASNMTMTDRAATLFSPIGVFGLIPLVIERVRGDVDMERRVVAINGLGAIRVGDRHRWPIGRVGDLVASFKDSMQAQHRQKGGAKAHTEGLKQSRQIGYAPVPAIVRPGRNGNG